MTTELIIVWWISFEAFFVATLWPDITSHCVYGCYVSAHYQWPHHKHCICAQLPLRRAQVCLKLGFGHIHFLSRTVSWQSMLIVINTESFKFHNFCWIDRAIITEGNCLWFSLSVCVQNHPKCWNKALTMTEHGLRVDGQYYFPGGSD